MKRGWSYLFHNVERLVGEAMEFDWGDSEQQFRKKVRAFLRNELPEGWSAIARHGPGSHEQTEFSLGFCPKLAEAGLLVPHWANAQGGAGMSDWAHLILSEEMWAAGEPRGPQYMNVNWIGPAITAFGTAEQRARFIPDMASGAVIWCQGFSEPGAGSDLANLATRAMRDGETYVINGSKIWTSYAGLAKHCFLLARTDGKPGEKVGITIFLIDMDTPGVEVRAIPSLIGHGDIHEVFFTDVTVPASSILGLEGDAWKIISFALANERVGIPRYELSARVLGDMVKELKARGDWKREAIRVRAGEALVACEAARILVYRAVDARMRGNGVGPDANIARVAVIRADHQVADFGIDFLPDTFTGDAWPDHVAHHERAIVSGIAAGAAEIQLGLVARRHLNLPREGA